MTVPRIGIGFDRHELVAGRRMVIGGVEIEHELGLAGHSDADVLLHAAMDAVLGAAGLDDLGTLFPDDDPRWRGMDSTAMAREVMARIAREGLQVLSMDAVLVGDEPRIRPHRSDIRASLSRVFGAPLHSVNVKGKSTEGGAGRGFVECTVVALLAPREERPPA